MKYTKATNLALHTVVYLAEKNYDGPIGVKELSEAQDIAPAYLSKVLSTLVKENIIKSVSGINGGYSLFKNWRELSFLDIIQAVEGKRSIFEDSINHNEDCNVRKIMNEAEIQLEQFLEEKKIESIVKV